MALLVRPAGPQDAPFLAWAMLQAGRAHRPLGWYDIALGLPESQCLELLARLALTDVRSWWHHSNFLVAMDDGDPVAALCAFGSAEGYATSEAALAEATWPLGWGPEDLAAVWTRGAYIFSCSVAVDDDLWTIENVAVRPSHRGMGATGLLLNQALARGRDEGFGQAQISFVIGNDPAERAYAKAGFQFAQEKRSPEFEAAVGAPGLRRFVRAL